MKTIQTYQPINNIQMRNKKFNLTAYQPYRSTHLGSTSMHLDHPLKNRYSPHKSAFLKREPQTKLRQADIENILVNKQGVFSVQKLLFDKKKEQKQLAESARLPNFNIKRFLERSAHKNTSKPDMSRSEPSPKRQATAQPALKRYWQRYLNEEITYADLTRQLNKNIIDATQRQKRNQSEAKCKESNALENPNKIEKSAFYINNFIKTTYRKRRFEHKVHLEEELPAKQQKKPAPPAKPAYTDSMYNQKNWHMVPWEKYNDTQEQEQFNPL